jgi:Immunoglobulin I-set domain.
MLNIFFFLQHFLTELWRLFQVRSEGNVEIVNVPYNTKLSIVDILRKNSGVYRIKAENASGKDEADVEITVLSKFFSNFLFPDIIYSLEAERF